MATLQAGVTGVQSSGGNTERGFGAAISISGARPDQNGFRLDGVSINDYSNGAPGSVLGDNLGIDAVEQVSVLGSNYPAEYGRTSGGKNKRGDSLRARTRFMARCTNSSQQRAGCA